MKKTILYFIGFLLFIGCVSSLKKKDFFKLSDVSVEEYSSFGDEISMGNVYYSNIIRNRYESLKKGDTIDVIFRGTVKSVCKAKGCWMKMDIGNNNEVMVKFKDYSFFVPKNIENDTVIIKGKAFVNELSVEEQRHYAADAKKTKEEIKSINTPKKNYSFVADAVLIKK